MHDHGEAGIPEDNPEAVRWYERAAGMGHVNAMFNLGVMYHNGEAGVPADRPAAIRWYRMAAGRDHLDAKLNLAALERGQ